MVEIVKLPIQKLKVVHVVRYLKELILRIKQHVRVPHVLSSLVLDRLTTRRMKRGQAVQQGATGTTTMISYTTTQNPPPPQHVPVLDLVSVHKQLHVLLIKVPVFSVKKDNTKMKMVSQAAKYVVTGRTHHLLEVYHVKKLIVLLDPLLIPKKLPVLFAIKENGKIKQLNQFA